jgi:hypothetical protein
MDNVIDALRRIWVTSGGDISDLDVLHCHGPRHVLPSIFDVTGAAAASIGAANLAAARLLGQRHGSSRDAAVAIPHVDVDRRHAAVAFRSERYLRVDGQRRPVQDPISGDYPTADGRWIRLHASLPAHRNVVCRVLDAQPVREAIAAAVAKWESSVLEATIYAAGGCAAMMRTTGEWRAHPQGQALLQLPVVEIASLGPAPPAVPPHADRPLAGIRVLDLTRVIAGPVCGRFLAACGADVLRITSPSLPDIEPLAIDTGFGKRSTHVNLRSSAGQMTFERLVADADVMVQSYRPGALARLGLSPMRLAALRPGIVLGELSGYGRLGPWAARRGFDSLVQMASGIAQAGAVARGTAAPAPLPAQVLDHASGYLLAFGIIRALTRRAIEGGSWHVQVSLARTGRWLEDFGRVDALHVADPAFDDVRDLLATTASDYGQLTFVRPPGAIAGAPHAWDRPPTPAGV